MAVSCSAAGFQVAGGCHRESRSAEFKIWERFLQEITLSVCVCVLADKISSPSHWWSIGTRVVWHLLRVSPGAPTNLACEGRVACLNGLVRGACQPHSSKRRFASQRPRRNRRRRATGSRRPDCPRRVGVANQSDTHSRVVPTGRGSRATLAKARLATVARGSRSTRPGSLYRQSSR